MILAMHHCSVNTTPHIRSLIKGFCSLETLDISSVGVCFTAKSIHACDALLAPDDGLIIASVNANFTAYNTNKILCVFLSALRLHVLYKKISI